MITRREVAELRVMMIEARVGGDRERARLLRELGVRSGELLALADAALVVRQVYRATAPGHATGELSVTVAVGAAALAAMRELDRLEEEARLADARS